MKSRHLFGLGIVLLCAHVIASAAPQMADDVANDAFVKWITAQPGSELWDHDQELEHYAEKLRADGRSKPDVDVAIGALEKRVWADEAAFWDKNYQNPSPQFETTPNALLVDAVKGRAPGRALDVEMGQGRNTVFLARQGWMAAGFDISPEGISQAKKQAAAAHVDVAAVVAKDTDYDFGVERWDLIAAIYPMEKRSLMRAVRALRPRGLIVVEGFHDTVKGPVTRFRTGELAERFKGFRILRDEDIVAKPDWSKTNERIVRFVAEKP
jgi:SAM-dependent methyltransferase